MHLSICTVTAPCPYCTHEFNDEDDSIITAVNRNKSGITIRRCIGCKRRVGLTYDITCTLRAFEVDPPQASVGSQTTDNGQPTTL